MRQLPKPYRKKAALLRPEVRPLLAGRLSPLNIKSGRQWKAKEPPGTAGALADGSAAYCG